LTSTVHTTAHQKQAWVCKDNEQASWSQLLRCMTRSDIAVQPTGEWRNRVTSGRHVIPRSMLSELQGLMNLCDAMSKWQYGNLQDQSHRKNTYQVTTSVTNADCASQWETARRPMLGASTGLQREQRARRTAIPTTARDNQSRTVRS
jgi:hypothetical protein